MLIRGGNPLKQPVYDYIFRISKTFDQKASSSSSSPPLSDTPVRTVTWASHVDMASGRPVETPTARVFDGRNVSLPSNAGAHNWPAMSYNPDTGLVYIPTMVFPARLTLFNMTQTERAA